MTTIILWYLVSWGGYNHDNNIVYSPPMKDIETCQTLKKEIGSIEDLKYVETFCIQIPTEVHK